MFKQIMTSVVLLMILNGCSSAPTPTERIIERSIFSNPPAHLLTPPMRLEVQESSAYLSDAELFAEDMRNLGTAAKDIHRFSQLQMWLKSQIQISVKRADDKFNAKPINKVTE